MRNNQYTPTSVRKLVDKFFSLQWCRDNFVVPLYEETSLPMSEGVIKIAIANYSYLGTIAAPIKERLNQSGYTCEFVERSQEEIQEILDLASSQGLVEKSGAWYSYNGDRIGQGRENAKNFLKDNPEVAQKIEKEIRSSGKSQEKDDENLTQETTEEEITVD